MSTINYRITMDLGALMELSDGINAQLFPLVNQAVNGIAQATASRWIESVQRAKLWSGEKDAYAKTITYRMTGDFSAVVESDYRYAGDIETGRPPRDLKQMLNTSMKVRVTKKGTRYLIIPFRHNADTVPQAARDMSMSTITGHTRRLSGTGAWSLKTQAPATVRQRKYNWGDRLAGPDVAKNQQGMVRMNTATRPGVKSSSYLTFRIMSEKSKGWIIPAQPGQHIAQGVQQEMQPVAEAFLTEAVKRTLG
jgi:hypothetical protein